MSMRDWFMDTFGHDLGAPRHGPQRSIDPVTNRPVRFGRDLDQYLNDLGPYAIPSEKGSYERYVEETDRLFGGKEDS